MKADMDDMPDYLRSTKKKGLWRRTLATGGEPIFSQQPLQAQLPPAEALPGNDQDWIRSTKAQQDAQASHKLERRQQNQSQPQLRTSFSDTNYIPQGIRNVVPAEPIQQAPVQDPQKKQEIVVIGKAGPKLSDVFGGIEGGIRRRDCKSMLNLGERNNSYNGRECRNTVSDSHESTR